MIAFNIFFIGDALLLLAELQEFVLVVLDGIDVVVKIRPGLVEDLGEAFGAATALFELPCESDRFVGAPAQPDIGSNGSVLLGQQIFQFRLGLGHQVG